MPANAAELPFAGMSYDFVICSEVLEHVPPSMLGRVCRETERVASGRGLIGVPYKRDIRVGRTSGYARGARDPCAFGC